MMRRSLWSNTVLIGLALGASPAAGADLPVLRPWATVTRHLEQGNLNAPMAVAFDSAADELWVADSKNQLMGLFTPDGTPLFVTNGGGSIDEPSRLAIGPDGNLWILDNDRSRIARLDWRGRPLPSPVLSDLPADPELGAIAFDDAGNLYLGENREGRVHVYDRSLDPWFRFGSRGYREGQFTAITDIAVSRDRIAVVDAIGIPVQVFNRRGELERSFGAHAIGVDNFSLPQGVAFDSRGRVVVVDALRHEIKFFDDRGRFLGRFGGYGSGPGQVKTPVDVAIDATDRLYVVERGNGRVQVFQIEEIGEPAPASRSERR